MKTYNTYQEAKIANPECEIFHVNGICFFNYEALASDICNPADYCMTVEKFLADGHKFVEGDLILDEGVIWPVSDRVNSDAYIYTVKSSNKPDTDDNERYILRAAALENQMNSDNLATQTPEEKEPELTKDDSPQGVISAISNRLHNIGCEHQDSELGEELGSMACDIWGVLPLISNESIQEKKPRTKVEYVKCEFSREWEAVKYYNEEGELFVIDCNGNYSNVNDISGAWYEVVCKNYDSIYLCIETTETPQQREERERLEAAIELHDLAQDAYFACDGGRDGSATWDKSPERVKSMYFAIVDKTNYRKELN